MKKTVIITGASKGIGAAMAILFARKGYNVVIGYNESYQLAKMLSSSLSSQGYNVVPIKANVANKLETDILIKEAVYKFGSVDVLINNAGVAFNGLITDTEEFDSDKIFDVDLKGVFNCCKSVTPVMVNQKSGKIINISSMWGQVGASCEVAYSASKAGVIGLTKALAKEVAPSNIRVNCVAPGVVMTDMMQSFDEETLKELTEETPLQKLGTPKNIADAVVFLASSKAEFITGQVLGVNGGFII